MLDIGAGTGRVTLELAARGVHVVALDVAAPLLAAHRCRAEGLPLDVVHLDRVSADGVATEARQVGFIIEPHLYIPETEQYLGSTVAVLRAP